MANDHGWLTIAQAARRSGMWPQTLRRMCLRGQFPGAKLERSPIADSSGKPLSYWLIPTADLDRYRPNPNNRGRPLKKGFLAVPKKKVKAAKKKPKVRPDKRQTRSPN